MEPLDDELAEMLMTEMEVAGSSDFVEWVSYLDPAERDIIVLRFVKNRVTKQLAATPFRSARSNGGSSTPRRSCPDYQSFAARGGAAIQLAWDEI